jgi:arylsulfatase A-like enzyme
MNVLFIIADALRADRLHCCGNPQQTSPVIDRLAREGVLLTNVIANANHTVPALVSAFTGLDVLSHGINDQVTFQRWGDLWRGRRTPFHVLRDHGYVVAGDDPPVYVPLGFDVGGRDVRANVRKHADRPFFIWHRTEETHLPYNPRPPYDTAFLPQCFVMSDSVRQRLQVIRTCLVVHRPGLTARVESGSADAIEMEGYQRTVGVAEFTESDRPAVLGLYDGCVKMLDEEVELYLSLLEEMRILEDTLVVLTSDHGEQLLERGAVGHSSCSLEGNLYEENIRVPLILRCPAILPRGKVIDCQVSQVDIMPTLFELLDLEMPEWADGRSLVPIIFGQQTDFCEEAYAATSPCGWQALDNDQRMIWCIRRPPWKLIRYSSPQTADKHELFNLRDDPGERHNLIDSHPDVGLPLQRKLNAWIARKNP